MSSFVYEAASKFTKASTITTSTIQDICNRLREHRITCKVCENQFHYAGNSGILAEPPITICAEAKFILLDMFN